MAKSAMGGILSKFKILLPNRSKPKGTSQTATFDPEKTNDTLPLPDYKLHLKDIFTERQTLNNYELMDQLSISDPDVSSALSSYLTVADQIPIILVKDIDGAIDRDGHKILNQIIEFAGSRRDYTKGFKKIQTLRCVAEELRHMMLLRGMIGVEAVMNEFLLLSEFRQVDMKDIKWIEKSPNVLIPVQEVNGDETKLDIPTFFVASYRKAPNALYSHGAFVSAINTVAARQQVINDLYRIMQVTGYPRIDITVLEEVMAKNCPADIKTDPVKFRSYLNARRNEVSNAFSNLRADQPLTHFDTVEVKILNDKNPGMSVDISQIIDVLNAQNQAGLKTMATVLGRGESGVNTATVEARLFAMNVESVNRPIGEILSQILTMALRFQGSESLVTVSFPDVDLRSDLEQEANKQLRSSRLRQDLSDGLIEDDEYHLEVYGRIRPENAPELSGTGFMSTAPLAVDAEKVSPNSDPLGKSVSSKSDNLAKRGSNNKKK